LSDKELEFYAALPNAPRRREWLLGRICAKEAIRRLVHAHSKLTLTCADVEIEQLSNGRPIVSARSAGIIGWQPIISISHKDGTAVALAGQPRAAKGAGIDIESITERADGFEQLAFTPDEQKALALVSGNERTTLATQMWCAKEAAGKALTDGLSNNPRSITVLKTSDRTSSNHVTFIARPTANSNPSGCLVHCFAEASFILSVASLDPPT
jgi:phosphopantetheinyl transferase